MPKGPQGQLRPPDVIANAIHIAQIATGEIQETVELPKTDQEKAIEFERKKLLAQKAGRLGGLKGGPARRDKLSPAKRKEIAKKAAKKRWTKPNN